MLGWLFSQGCEPNKDCLLKSYVSPKVVSMYHIYLVKGARGKLLRDT